MNEESTTPSPIDAGSRLQVLWNDHVVDAANTTASLVVHQPEYAGVAMTHDKPWEGDGSDYHCIVPDHDEKSAFLRMYYLGWAIACGWKDVKDRFSADGVRVCYAESRDNGLSWTKPKDVVIGMIVIALIAVWRLSLDDLAGFVSWMLEPLPSIGLSLVISLVVFSPNSVPFFMKILAYFALSLFVFCLLHAIGGILFGIFWSQT